MITQATHYSEPLRQRLEELLNQLTPQPSTLSEQTLRAVLDDSASRLYLLEEENRVVGMLTLGIYHSPTGSKGWIEDVVVDDACRGRGYGRMLVAHAIEEAKKAGVAQLMLTSNPLRVAANKLYQAMGFERKETNCYKMDKGL
ncbi:MAG: GNAT family N-acetyltransferase [Alistipes sp.]|nr:GNAT family N-acetyltransferase [Alistipes sp.]